MTGPNPQEGGKPDVCQSCYKTDAIEGVHVRRDGGEWVASTLRRCANPECQEIRSGSLEDRFTHLRNVYAYKYFGDYQLSPEQSVAVWDAYAWAMKVPALLEALKGARAIVAEELDCLIRSCSLDGTAATLDADARDEVARVQASLDKIDAALTLTGAHT